MKNNQQLIEKAITSLSFGGGIGLSTSEADRFIDYMVDQSFVKNNVRIERMNVPTKKIDKIGIGKKILRPGITGVDPGNTVGISTSQIELKTKEVIAIVEIGDDSIEDNIEGDALVDHIMKMVAIQASTELEEAYLYGKEVAGGAQNAVHITQLFDGWMTIAKEQAHVLDAATFLDGEGESNRYIEKDKLSKMVKTLPNQYRINRSNLRYLVADDIHQDYSDLLSNRPTAMGDSYTQGTGDVRYGNILMQSVPLMATSRPVAVIGGIAAEVAAPAAAGASTITVDDAAGIQNGDILAVGFGTAVQEVKVVAGVNVNAVTFTTPFYYAHTAEENVKEVTEDGTESMLTDYRNLILGIQRNIRVETQRDARRRCTSFVLTLRVDTQIENPDAIVVMENLKVK